MKEIGKTIDDDGNTIRVNLYGESLIEIEYDDVNIDVRPDGAKALADLLLEAIKQSK
jgi:hypothetical protein